MELLKVAIEQAGYTGKIEIGMDCAASEFYKDGKYDLDFKNPDSDPAKWLTSKCERGREGEREGERRGKRERERKREKKRE